jgi:phospholipase C
VSLTRRQLLRAGAAGGAGVALPWLSIGAVVQRARATMPQPGATLRDIEHVVILMQENRSFFTRADLPFHYALADAFTICDNYFCSVLGPTNPNRIMSMSATTDAAGVKGGPCMDNSQQNGQLLWTSYPERAAGGGDRLVRLPGERQRRQQHAAPVRRVQRRQDRPLPAWQHGHPDAQGPTLRPGARRAA